LYVWVSDVDRHIRTAPTNYDIRAKEWDAVAGDILIENAGVSRQWQLVSYRDAMRQDLERLKMMINELEKLGYTAADDIIDCWIGKRSLLSQDLGTEPTEEEGRTAAGIERNNGPTAEENDRVASVPAPVDVEEK
jgi:hypothetical protein